MAQRIPGRIPQTDRFVRSAPRPRVARFAALLAVAAAIAAVGCERAVDSTPGIEEPTAGRPLYEATVRPDPAAGTLSAEWRFRFIANERTSDSVMFLLSALMNVDRVGGPAIHGHRVEPFQGVPGWNQVVVQLDSLVEPGSEVAIEFDHSGAPAFPPSGINSLTEEYVELNVDSGWHPFFSTFDQLMTGTLRLHLPEDWNVVASGESELRDGVHVVTNTVPQLDVAFSAAADFVAEPSAGFTIYHRGADPLAVSAAFVAAEECAAYLNERFGRDDPLSAFRLVFVNRPGSAYNRRNYVTLSHFDPANVVATRRFVCHELAHSWSWGASPMGPDHWLTEGFAEYVAARFVRDRFGEASFDSIMTAWDLQSRTMGPVWTPDMQGRGPDLLLYRKAPVVLSRLEARIGREAFDDFLLRYMTGHGRTTTELLTELEAVAGSAAVEAFLADLASGPVDAGP